MKGLRSFDGITEECVATNIAIRREPFFREHPGAVDLAAKCTFAFHGTIKGSLTTALRSRDGSYAREQGTGKRALTIEDVCELVTSGGAEGRRAVAALLSPILEHLDAGPVPFLPRGEVVADFAMSAGRVSAAFMRGDTALRVLQHLLDVDAKSRVLRKVLRTAATATTSPEARRLTLTRLTA